MIRAASPRAGPAMKTLFLVRHAKSSKDDPTLTDKERPLNDRGRRDAPKMGERLAKRDVEPDLIVSSPAVRALATAQIFAEKLDYRAKNIVVDDRDVRLDPHGTRPRAATRPGDLLAGRRHRKHRGVLGALGRQPA